VSSDLAFPLDLLPNTGAARECLARYDAAITKWQGNKRTPAEVRRDDLRFAEMIKQWLNDNPQVTLLLDLYRKKFKRR
jgi:hypothetical protein